MDRVELESPLVATALSKPTAAAITSPLPYAPLAYGLERMAASSTTGATAASRLNVPNVALSPSRSTAERVCVPEYAAAVCPVMVGLFGPTVSPAGRGGVTL